MTESRCRVEEEANAYQDSLVELEAKQPEIEAEIKERTDELYAKKIGSYSEFNTLFLEAIEQNPDFIEAVRNQVMFLNPCHKQMGEQLFNVFTDYIKEVAKQEIESEYS